MHQTSQVSSENPPPYESATSQQQLYYNGKATVAPTSNVSDDKPPTTPQSSHAPLMIAGPSYVPQQAVCPPTVYHYVNPQTGEHVTSLLPPDHPEMICFQEGGHVTETKFGLLGVLAAIFWFPLGVGLCILDRRVRCRRCGAILADGVSGIGL